VKEIMSKSIISIDSNESVYTTAFKLRENKIGSIFGIDADRNIGIVTKRDIIEGTVLSDKNPHSTPVHEIWNTDIITIDPLERIDKAVELMETHHIKKLVVVHNKEVVGIITVTDISKATKHIENRFMDSCLNKGSN
jgi:CBS domain-containing protein